MKSETRKARVEDVLDRMHHAFSELVVCMHDLEECGVNAQVKKLDTITGKLENVTHELYDRVNGRTQKKPHRAATSDLRAVKCSYTGGGIYVFTARWKDVYLMTDFYSFGTYDVPWEDIGEEYDCDYETHWKTSAFPLPTWEEILTAVRENYGKRGCTNLILDEVERIVKRENPDLTKRLDEEE